MPSAGRSAERGREGCTGRRVRRGKERAGRTVQSGLVVRRYSRAKGTAQHRGVRQPELLRAGYQGRISGYQAIWQGMRAYRAAAGRAEAEAAPSQEEAQSDHVTCRSPLFPARKGRGRRGRRCAAGVWAPDRGCAGAKGQRARRRATTRSRPSADFVGNFARSTEKASAFSACKCSIVWAPWKDRRHGARSAYGVSTALVASKTDTSAGRAP